MRTLVVGLGNPILTDDGVGVRVAEAVRRALPPDAAVDVREVSVGGLTLMEHMVGYQRVILIDALTGVTGPPGTVRRMTLEDLRAVSVTQHSASTHDTTLITALEMGQRMGLPLPNEVVIYGVVTTNVIDFSELPTPAVAAAIPLAVTAVLAELRLPKSVAVARGTA
jgi:hydrogenase maturation protease